MKVRMKVQMSGTRNGELWPAVGEIVELSDAEGAKYCANGTAEPVAARAKAETATVKADDVEERKSGLTTKRGPGRPRKTAK